MVGCLEIKYLYCDREKSIDNIVQKRSCIGKVNGSYILKENHQYFYQIQPQLLVTNYEYGDLFLWTKTDNIRIRIVPHDAVQMETVEMSKKFFLKAILRELLGHFQYIYLYYIYILYIYIYIYIYTYVYYINIHIY